MASNYEVTVFRPEFAAEIAALQRHLWSPDASINARYLAWKYAENPYLDETLIFVALESGKVIAMRGFFGARWAFARSRQPHEGICAGDLVVATEHRGKGLFRRLMDVAVPELRRRGHRVIFNFSASPVTYLASRRMGWRCVGPYGPWRWTSGRKSAARSLHTAMRRLPVLWRSAGRRLPLLERPGGSAMARFAAAITGRPALTFATMPRPQAMASLAARTRADPSRLCHVADEDYFAWRYANPLSSYGFLYAGSADLDGYLVVRMPADANMAEAAVVDWRANDVATLAAMFKPLLGANAFDSISLWSATLSPELQDMLRGFGFRPYDDTRGIAGFEPGVLVRPTAPNPETADWELDGRALLDQNSWDLRMIYSDSY